MRKLEVLPKIKGRKWELFWKIEIRKQENIKSGLNMEVFSVLEVYDLELNLK